MTSRRAALALAVVVAIVRPLAAQAEQPRDSSLSVDGPPDPSPPALVARDQQGRTTVRAERLSVPLRIDGQLDELVYAQTEPISDFIQMDPSPGMPANERTEAWIFFDDANVYVTMRAWESRPDRIIAKEMRRDSNNIRQADCLAFGFDTFLDRQNAFFFEVNPLGAFVDSQTTDRQVNSDWNIVWSLAVARFEGGWMMEAAIPFKSLRYQTGPDQRWGLQLRRYSRWKNEVSFLTRVPPSLGMGRASIAASLYATLVEIETPQPGINLEIKPYVTADLSTDNNTAPRRVNAVNGDVGLDVKYAITQNLTADLTYNTDFAQVEADEQQVNLTRFSLLFPEKREFFLENRDLFTFGGVTGTGLLSGGGGDAPILFYSRRIGLARGREIPIQGGGRLTGRFARVTVGALDIRTDSDAVAGVAATTFPYYASSGTS